MNDITITHTIFKNVDIDKYLSEEDRIQLKLIQDKIALGRSKDNKTPYNTYLIVNSDEPYYKEVLDLVQRHEFYKHY